MVVEGTKHLVLNGRGTFFLKDRWLGDQALKNRCSLPNLDDSSLVSEFIDASGSWDWEKLINIPRELKEQLASFSPVPDLDDQVIWSAAPNGLFSVSSAYNLLLQPATPNPDWMKVWQLDIPPRIKHFLWLLLHNRLLTKEACVRRGLTDSLHCPRCDAPVENTCHLLRDCQSSRDLWCTWLRGESLDKFNSLSLSDWVRFNLSRQNVLVSELIPWPILFAFGCWYIWKWRNLIIFENGSTWPANASYFLLDRVRDFLLSRESRRCEKLKSVHLIAWNPPPQAFIKINTDGAAVANPGLTAIGGIARDNEGMWLWGFSKLNGHGTVLKAEISAILLGLKIAWEKGYRRVFVESDSLLAVKKLTGSPSRTDPLFHLIFQCQLFIAKEWDCMISHIFREANYCADHLAGTAFINNSSQDVLELPPLSLRQFIEEDLLGVARPRACRL
ncbi:hypothetical protein REPUB_Repub17cG0121000 [Reevesia pubescens]